ncbi:MAG TPA: hypothetical protein VGE27_12355, partial [Gemmatimonas sp.]|uniref:lysophospholipid acyltransferase family protein n=1 Tax=Gemmatimonas sp. TaxID=1962908 RepID=UPI002ED9DEBD
MTDQAPRRVPTISHRLEYIATRVFVGALRLLPWRAASWIGGQIARIAYWPLGIRRGVTTRQIAAAFPDRSPSEVARLAVGSFDSLGRTSIETAILPGTNREDILKRYERVEGWEYVERAMANGKGLVIATGHLGNWELGGAYVAARGLAFDAVVRGMGNPIFEGYVNRTRRKIGMEVILDREAVKRVPRSLRDNRAIAFVADHDALGLASTFVPFFGRPAKTPRGAAVFALRFDAPVVFIVSVRQPSGRYALLIEPVEVPLTGDREVDVDAIVLRFTQMLEERIR